MSAPMSAPPAGAPQRQQGPPAGAIAAIPFQRLVQAEVRKSYDTRASFWLLVATGAIVMIAETLLLILALANAGTSAFGDYLGFAAYASGVTLPVVGIMLVTSEWSQRTAMVTFALEPRRIRVVLAKLVVGLLLTFATLLIAVVIALGCTLVATLAHPDQTEWGLNGLSVPGFVVTQCTAMIAGFALATLLLNTPAAIVLIFVYRFVVPGIFAALAALLGFFNSIWLWIDFQSAQAPVYDWSVDTGEEWGHLLTSGALWLVLPLVLGILRILRAEVK